MQINKAKIKKFLSNTRELKNNYIKQYVLQITENEFNKIENGILKNYNFFYWNKPEESFKFLAGLGRGKSLQMSSKFLGSEVVSNYKNGGNIIPLLVGGKKFTNYKNTNEWKDFENEEWLLPKFMIIKMGSKRLLVINFIKGVLEDNIVNEISKLISVKAETKNNNKPKIHFLEKLNLNKWKKSVEDITKQIKANKVFKTVLAGKTVAAINNKLEINYLADTLFRNNKTGYLFLFKKNNSIFFGASPEKLFSIKNNLLQTEALAGTIKRGINKKEDKNLERELLKSKKNLTEHKSVVSYIMRELEKVSTKIKVGASINIKKLKYVQHLQTTLTAKVKNGKNVFDIIKILHPTPAVCGFPKNKAMELINKLEKFDRGLYSGVVGWANKNEAEFAVAIRSALIKKNKLHVYAGCGIVKDSVPIDELREINSKLKTILSLFNK